MSQSVAIYPGSFDPLTNGHGDIITRAASLFKTLVVAVAHNPNKKTIFTPEERVALIQEEFGSKFENVEVVSHSGLLVDFARERKARVVVRGLRAVSDYDYETQLALMNRRLAPEIETLFLAAREDCSYISSSVVKQIATFGGDVSAIVPPAVKRALDEKYRLGLIKG